MRGFPLGFNSSTLHMLKRTMQSRMLGALEAGGQIHAVRYPFMTSHITQYSC